MSALIGGRGPHGNGANRFEPTRTGQIRVGGQMYGQNTAREGFVKFERVPYSEFTVQVVAPGYETASQVFEVNTPGAVSVTLSLKPLEAEDAATSRGFYALPPKVQRSVGKHLF
jgi:hypothetical protein